MLAVPETSSNRSDVTVALEKVGEAGPYSRGYA
jgi:hypothetical protein